MSVAEPRGLYLPTARGAAVFHWNGQSLKECVGTYNETEYAHCLTDVQTDTDVRVRRAGAQWLTHPIEVWRGTFAGESTQSKQLTLESGSLSAMTHFALKDGVLLVGGRFAKGRVMSLDLQAPSPEWRTLPSPPSQAQAGAQSPHDSITRVCLDGDRFLCVDTRIGQFDKRWVVYDVSNPRTPRLQTVVPMQLEAPRTEFFEQVVVTAQFIVAFTRIQSGMSWQYGLRFFDRKTLLARFHWSLFFSEKWEFPPDEPTAVQMVDGCDELLAICRSRLGVGLVDLRGLHEGLQPREFSVIARDIRWIKRADHDAWRAYFCGPGHLAIAWRAPDGSHEVALAPLSL